jgi:hypothetical protein
LTAVIVGVVSVVDLASADAFLGREVPVLPGEANTPHRRALHQVWVVGHEMGTLRHHACLKGGVPDRQLRRALAGLTGGMVGLEHRADCHTGSQSEVVVLPRRAHSVYWYTLLEIGVPL